MKAWHLIAPDWASLDTIWRSPSPFVLWPVCEKNLLSYWLDEAVRRSVPSVSIETMDRPHMIRHWLDKRDLWSRSIEVHSQPGAGEGKDCFILCGLPGLEDLPPVLTPKELMQRWYEMQVEALRRRDANSVHLDHEYRPGVWFGPGVRTSPDVLFTPPCWVGSHVSIGAGCRLGPNAFIGPGVFLDEDVEMAESIVCEDTYVGSHTTLKRAAVQGGLLMDLERGVGVEVLDEFMLAPVGAAVSQTPWWERVLAVVTFVPLELLAWLVNYGTPPVQTTIQLSRSLSISLQSYARGPLCLRRAPWLRLVANGKIRLLGILPRAEEDFEKLHPSARSAIEKAPVGVFSLADLYHCHSPKQPDEWMHAAFQAGAPHGVGQGLALKSLIRIALTNPPD